MRASPLLVLAALLVAGCAIPATVIDGRPPDRDFSDLASSGKKTLISDGSVRHDFEAILSGKAGALGVGEQAGAASVPMGTFDVDDRVAYVELQFTAGDGGAGNVGGVISDDEGRIQCIAFPEGTCTVPVPKGSLRATWTVDARVILGAAIDKPVQASVVLHPFSHMFVGDPLAGVDPSIRFRESETGVDGSEDNIGVLGDGTIFTQKSLATLRSRDDGVTWERVSPPGNDQQTLDPMLFVDPYRGIVYVDHLYVGCSVLSFSLDAGATWVTNPAACGLPGDDHQKIASGPSPLPIAPLPAVYYSFSSFAEGAWASRSYDGGVTFTPAPIVGVRDGRSFANTGPIFADEAGNVYVPYYMCDGEGYMGAGVSHDHGRTWKFVVAAEQPGECYDPDPGLWSDTAGNVYIAYHRPDGVYFAASTDKGETWGAPVKVSPDALLSFVHVDMVAGDEGRLAIVYRATPDTAKGPDGADGWAAWHLYVSFVEDALGRAPTIRTAIVNDPADPIQRGPICTGGVTCYGGSRNLLDFIDIAVGPDGRVYPTYTDGCDKACPLPADSRSRLGLVGVQEAGPRLFAGRAPWAT